ncbi:MAG: sensor histidine kinase N-terminal domain-containing protein [Rubrivivax sp.]|nr:sensor histidine kinase N-terminal domain-containing protein [Rubrivivax sp.]
MSLRPASLQGRLLAAVLGLVAAVWMIAALMIWRDARHELDELLDAHLAQAAAVLVVQQLRERDEDHAQDDEDHHVADLPAPSLHRYAARTAFQVWHHGRLVIRSELAPAQAFGPVGHRAELGFSTMMLDGVTWRVFAARGAERDMQVFVGEQVAARSDILKAVLRSLLWPMVVALPLLALLLWWAVSQGLSPLRTLRAQLSRRDAQALQPVTLTDAPLEMVPMVEALNSLLARIQGLLASERRFTADAAHELRTPLAALRAQAQVAQASADADERRHALGSVLLACDRLARLIDQLLTLARLEAGTPATGCVAVDLASLARLLAAESAPQALARGQELAVDGDGPLIVQGNESLLGVLLRNLLDNALRYSPEGAQVRLGLSAVAGGGAQLMVEDSGPGLAEADLARLGERFFRVLGNEAPGSGLGWSIIRRVAQAQGIVVELGRAPTLGGLRVTLNIPARPPDAVNPAATA